MTLIASILFLLSCACAWGQPTLRIGVYNTLAQLTNSVPVITVPVAIIKGVQSATNRDGFFLLYDPTATNDLDESLVFAPASGIGRWFKMTGMAGQPVGNYITSLTGAVLGNGPGAAATQLSATGVTPGVYGSATLIPTFEVGSHGRIMGATNVPISAGTTINSTDGAIPVRGSSSAFTNSILFAESGKVSVRKEPGTNIATLFDDGSLYFGRFTEDEFGGSYGYPSLIMFSDAIQGESADMELYLGTRTASSEHFFQSTVTPYKSQWVLDSGPTLSRIEASTTTNWATIGSTDSSGNQAFHLSGYGSIGYAAPYYFRHSGTNLPTSAIFRVDNGETNLFQIAGDAVFPNDATKYFDGTGHWSSLPASSGINATNIATGTVDNTEFGYLSNVTGDIQTQISLKQDTGNYITALTGAVTATGPGSVIASLGSFTSAELATAVSNETGGTGVAVFNNGATLSNSVTLATGSLDITVRGNTTTPAIRLGGDSNSGIYSAAAGGYYGFISAGVVTFTTDPTAGLLIANGKPLTFGSGLSAQTWVNQESVGVLQLGVDATNATAHTIKAHDGLGTDKDGADVRHRGGASTGSGRPGSFEIGTSLSGSTSSTANGYSARFRAIGKYVTLTDAGTNTLISVNINTNQILGLDLFLTVYATDGTDTQSQSRSVTIDSINKAGSLTSTVDNTRTNATAASSGTLGFTVLAEASGTTNLLVRVAADSSLSTTTFRAKLMVKGLNSGGLAVITEQ